MPPAAFETPVRLGVSSCLLGNQVRFDAGHKRDVFLVETFGPFVEWVSVCPEVELGLGVPRPTLRLERAAGAEVRLVMPATGADYTGAMRAYARRRVAGLAALDLSGYVFKKDSPSCGMERVRVRDASGSSSRTGRGLFAEELMRRFPHLPVEEEGRLGDAVLRETFVERVFAYRRLRALFTKRWTVGDLVAFHTAHKLQLLAHVPAAYVRLGRVVATAKSQPRAAVCARYEADFMHALATPSTRQRHTNVLQHMPRSGLDDGARRELRAVIDDYSAGLIPLVVPITLIQHHARQLDVPYLRGQVYLAPHPKELMLRNHV